MHGQMAWREFCFLTHSPSRTYLDVQLFCCHSFMRTSKVQQIIIIIIIIIQFVNLPVLVHEVSKRPVVIWTSRQAKRLMEAPEHCRCMAIRIMLHVESKIFFQLTFYRSWPCCWRRNASSNPNVIIVKSATASAGGYF